MFEVEYLTNEKGQTRAVVIPIELWDRLLPKNDASVEELSEGVEDYCLGKAMDEAKSGPLLNREEALKYLEE